MSDGRDTGMVLKAFRVACLSYQPSNVSYREHVISRTALIGMRRDLVDKMGEIIQNCDMFNKASLYPRRYFDDLVVE